jgi:topoisomerase-4 subunit A
MGLEAGEKLVAAAIFAGRSILIRGIGRNGKEKEVGLAGAKLDHHFGHRARMGRVLPDRIRPLELRLPAKPQSTD